MQLRYRTSGSTTNIEIYDTAELYGEFGRFRIMQFSEQAVQGAIDLDRPDRVVLEYPRALIHLMKQNDPDFEDVFAIGHGIGTLPRYFAEKRFKVAELEEAVVEASRTWFDDTSADIAVGDGRSLLEREKPGVYDYIVLDAFTAAGTPRHLVTSEFFRIVRDKLRADGAVLLNLIGKGGNDGLIRAVYATLGEQFPYTGAFALHTGRAADAINIVMMGGGKPIRFYPRHMAGFSAFAPGPGHVLTDGS